jgi:1,4-alpha-glucan branching enzyme
MSRTLRSLAPLFLLPLLAGCAGGWRGGAPPAEWAADAATSSAPASVAGPAGAAAGTHATADGAVFVWKAEGSIVNVAGDFNAWSTSADPLKKQADGSWMLEKKLAAGRYAYKFVIDSGTWKADPSVSEGVDDGFGGKNSVVVVGGAAAAAPVAKAATPVAPAAKGAGAAVTAAGVVFKFAGPASTVNLAGEFNNWSTSADPLVKNADGSFTLTKALPAGRYAYKFVLDGANWKEDPNAAESVDDGYGGKNSVVVVGGDAGATPAPAAAATSPAAPAAAAVLPLAAGAKPRAPQLTAEGVLFTYAGPAKTGVALCGDFNAWATTADGMTQQADGTWTITKKLAAGSYAYKFLVDGGSWKPDDGNTQGKDDGFGGKNSVVVVK